MGIAKVWDRARRWLLRQRTPLETLTPEQTKHLVLQTYVTAFNAGRSFERSRRNRREYEPSDTF